MHFLSKIFYFLFISHCTATESVGEFTFNAIPLGHSGLLITWKPNIRKQENISKQPYTLMFKEYLVEDDGMFQFDNNKSYSVLEKINEFNETSYISCDSLAEQFKIHSLKENKLYEIIIQQYNGQINFPKINLTHVMNKPHSRKYSVKMRTKTKSRKIPEKPYFVLDQKIGYMMIIRWFPCGKERICSDNQESGTHFGVTIREPYNTKKWIEVEAVEIYSDHMKFTLWPGRKYEVVVFSMNGAYKTNSDMQEIFLKSVSAMVQRVNVISLPDSSVLITWKPPIQALDAAIDGYLVSAPDFSGPDAKNEAPMVINVDHKHYFDKYFVPTKQKRTRLSKLKFGSMYNFMIIPFNRTFHFGFEYRVIFKLQAYDNDLPIARPDFSYNFEKRNGECNFELLWLPCGQSFNCENTRPGSEHSFEIRPQPIGYSSNQLFGYYNSTFDMGTEYYVRLTSSIGRKYSEPVIKYFKDCKEMKKVPSKKTDEL